MTDLGQCAFSLLHVNFKHLVDIVFADDFRSKRGRHYDIVLYSFCRLWNRMIKCFSHQSGQLEAYGSSHDSSRGSVTDLTSVLLERLKSGQFPVLCRGKCLSVLMQSVYFDPSSCAAVPAFMLTAAERTLSMLCSCYSNDKSLSAITWPFDCCRSTNDHQTSFTGSQSFGTSRSVAADSLNCATIVGMETQDGTLKQKPDNQHCVTVTTTAVSSDSESMSGVHNTSLTAGADSYGPSSSVQTCPSSCSVRSSEEFCDHEAGSHDIKLVRKFILLVLRSLDIASREPADQCKPLIFSGAVLPLSFVLLALTLLVGSFDP